MAWIGAIVALGLGLLGLDVLRERIRDRLSRRRAERGLPPIVWSPRRRSITAAAALGTVAAVFGALLLLRSTTSSSSSETDRLNVISTTTAPPATTTSPRPTTTLDPGRPVQQVRVAVVNASGVAGAAQQKSDALAAIGYQMVGLANGTPRTGSAVQCIPGFEKEAVTLAKNAGGVANVEPFPTPPPPASANSDCVVVLGK